MSDLSPIEIYTAFETRTPMADVMIGVKTTGIFCRPGCPARLPKFENCEFFESADGALQAGYRACKRCHPMGDDPAMIRQLISLVEEAGDNRVGEDQIRTLGIDPATARRRFKAALGISFSDYGRLRRLGRAAQAMAKGSSVIEAQFDAGFESPSGFRSAYAKAFGVSPSDDAPDPLFIDWIDTPLGRMVCVADEASLYLVEFTDRVRLPRQFARLRKTHKRAVVPGGTGLTKQLRTELAEYFKGERQDFTVSITTSGTEFQDGVWRALQTIAYGQTWSYADLASRIGNEKAVRAVASANGANGLAILIPCHRVIGSDGGLGGYAGGLDRKRKLLALEARVAGRDPAPDLFQT